jgi:hypothetical protein
LQTEPLQVMNKLICTFFAFWTGFQMLFGQIQRVKDFEMPYGISEIEVDKIITGLDQKLNEYQRLGKLANPKTHLIDRESTNAFKAMFDQDAKVYNDLQEETDDMLLDVETYASIARNFFVQDGIRFNISDPVIKRIEVYDEEIVCFVNLFKSIDQFYTNTGDVKQESRTFNLEFLFAIPKSSLSTIKIRTIRSGIDKMAPADYSSYVGIDLCGGIQQIEYTTSPDFKKFGAEGTISAKTSTVLQGGFVWYSNFIGKEKGRKKNLFVTAGLNVRYSKIEGKLNNYSLPAENPFVLKLSDGTPFDSLVYRAQKVDVNEKLTFVQVQLPIGAGYRLIHKNTMALMLDLTYVPGISLFSKAEIGDSSIGIYNLYGIKGKANYNFIESEQSTNILATGYDLLIKDRSLGVEPINYSWKPKLNLTHQVGVSLTFFKDFVEHNTTFGMALGIHAIIGLSPALKNQSLDNGALFSGIKDGKDPQYQDTGILGSYIQDVTLRNFGIRVVFYRKSSHKP